MKRLLAVLVLGFLSLGVAKCRLPELPPLPPPSPSPSAEPIPAPTPTLSPIPEPTPIPEPSPSATPLPSPTPWPACAIRPDCGGPEGPEGVWGCCSEHEGARYGGDVEKAVRKVMEMDGMLQPSGQVVDEKLFRDAVMLELRMLGYCVSASGGDGTDEIGVKLTDSYSEQYDILVGPWPRGTPGNRLPAWGHTVSCKPARF